VHGLMGGMLSVYHTIEKEAFLWCCERPAGPRIAQACGESLIERLVGEGEGGRGEGQENGEGGNRILNTTRGLKTTGDIPFLRV